MDGELLDMDSGPHESHEMTKHVEITCDSDEECDHNVFVFAGDGDEDGSWVTDKGENVVIHKEIEMTCSADEEDGTSCSDKMIWVSEGDDIDLEELHEMHEIHTDGDAEGHKVIMIKKHVVIED